MHNTVLCSTLLNRSMYSIWYLPTCSVLHHILLYRSILMHRTFCSALPPKAICTARRKHQFVCCNVYCAFIPHLSSSLVIATISQHHHYLASVSSLVITTAPYQTRYHHHHHHHHHEHSSSVYSITRQPAVLYQDCRPSNSQHKVPTESVNRL